MNPSPDDVVRTCTTAEDYAEAVSLTKEYAAWLGFGAPRGKRDFADFGSHPHGRGRLRRWPDETVSAA